MYHRSEYNSSAYVVAFRNLEWSQVLMRFTRLQRVPMGLLNRTHRTQDCSSARPRTAPPRSPAHSAFWSGQARPTSPLPARSLHIGSAPYSDASPRSNDPPRRSRLGHAPHSDQALRTEYSLTSSALPSSA